MAKQQETAGGSSSRSRTRERRQEREREKRRQQQITLVIIIVFVAVLAFGGFFLASQPAEAPMHEGSAALYEGLERSKTEEGFPLLGDPDALIEVKEYSSFDCSHCADFHETTLPTLLDRVRAGDINFIFVPLYGTGGIQNGLGAAQTAICAGEQGKFWEMHDALFSWQKLYGVEAFSQNRLTSGVDNLGLDRSLQSQCLGSDIPTKILNASIAEVQDLGSDFIGTPMVVVNGVVVASPGLEDINAAIDDALAALGPEATPEATAEVTEEPAAEMTEESMPEATEESAAEATEAPAAEVTQEVMPEETEAPVVEATAAVVPEVTEAVVTMTEVESVCLVTDIGKINDGTFNQTTYEGMIRAAEEFDLQTTYIETQAQTDYAANIQTCINEGYDIVIAVGYMLSDALYEAAVANPDLYFIGVDQSIEEPLPNLVGLGGREDQGGFLAGAMAGLMTQSNVVAGVYGIDIPPVVKFRNGFEQGVNHVNPDISVLGVYIDDFQAPDRGAEAAMQFLGEDADVIFGAGGPTGSGGIKRAAEMGTKVIGVDLDEYYTTFGGGETPGAENLITSAIKRFDVGVYDLITMIVEGQGFPEDSSYIMSVANNGIGFAEAHDADVPRQVTVQMNAILKGLGNGSIETGVDPITGQLLEPKAEVTAEAAD